MQEQWCSTTEAGRRIGCNSQTVINYIEMGVLQGAQNCKRGRWLVWEPSVEKLLAERARQIDADPQGRRLVVA